MGNHMQGPAQQGEETAFIEGKRRLTRAEVNRAQGLLLAESSPGKRGSLSSSCWALLPSQCVRVPPAGLLTV